MRQGHIFILGMMLIELSSESVFFPSEIGYGIKGTIKTHWRLLVYGLRLWVALAFSVLIKIGCFTAAGTEAAIICSTIYKNAVWTTAPI